MAPGIECRTGGLLGVHQLVITFPKNITLNPPNGTPAVRVSSGVGSVSRFVVNNNEVTVDLTGVANAQTLALTLSNVSDGTTTADVIVSTKFLAGDVTGDGLVNSGDIAQSKSQSGATFGFANCRNDVNLDGVNNSADVALVKSKSGTALPSAEMAPRLDLDKRLGLR
jgi:hypothetical protein